jgi:hypothetical protein
MEKFCFIVRVIALTMGLAACTGLNKEVLDKDVELLEEVNDDTIQLIQSKPIDPKPKKQRILQRNRNLNDKVINLNYEVSQRVSCSLV